MGELYCSVLNVNQQNWLKLVRVGVPVKKFSDGVVLIAGVFLLSLYWQRETMLKQLCKKVFRQYVGSKK